MVDLSTRIGRLSEPQRRLLRLRLGRSGVERSGEPRLVGYIVPRRQASLTAAELRGFLLERLPEYMVPSTWVFLDTFPMTSRGKVDRGALLGRARSMPEQKSVRNLPSNQHEQAVAAIWEDALGLRAVGRDDNFFDLGGHSLLLPNVLTNVRAISGKEVSMMDLFRYPTVQTLAAYLADGGQGADGGDDVRRLKETREAGVRRLKQRRSQRQASRTE
ncbi:hypothetical protein W02_10580 [Nitrospira sp. KM1]|uniref:phosphopantetheine-binding protein n=1 Tax=Nitrospira sp. KM1 TaxID=1936990 RepID=UPI0013A72347|nr:phosphopantetheine-binding protein [Nitrospira sp. KM1]BCA53918.1 hypothetical protein W02_10580 [Nitrospira sp. KM1]